MLGVSRSIEIAVLCRGNEVRKSADVQSQVVASKLRLLRELEFPGFSEHQFCSVDILLQFDRAEATDVAVSLDPIVERVDGFGDILWS